MVALCHQPIKRMQGVVIILRNEYLSAIKAAKTALATSPTVLPNTNTAPEQSQTYRSIAAKVQATFGENRQSSAMRWPQRSCED
jgi:hypothetical protein